MTHLEYLKARLQQLLACQNNIMEEVWKDVALLNEYWGEEVFDFGYYDVSNFGRVRSTHRYKFQPYSYMKVMSPQVNRDGYLDITLKNSLGTKSHLLVHRAVAILFIPNPTNLEQVDHIDEDKTNAHISNLQWMSKSDNIKKTFEQGRLPWNKGKKMADT